MSATYDRRTTERAGGPQKGKNIMGFKEALNKKKDFIITTEIQPPMEDEIQVMMKEMDKIRGRVDGLSVPQLEIEGVVAETIRTCQALSERHFDPILHTTTREKNRLELQADLVRASEAGVKNILAFTDDYRITGDSLQEIMFFHVDVSKLFSVLDSLKEGRDIQGKELKKALEFNVGTGVESSWGKKTPDLELQEMGKMIEQGTSFFLSTPVFDLDVFEKFMQKVKPFHIPVIAEVIILRTAGMAHFINRHMRSGLVPEHLIKKLVQAPDKEKASLEIFSELIRGLKELCQGVHIIPIGVEDKLAKYLDAAKL
jgi:5,10-methylenetetrahydrofolate reductase